MFSFYWDFTTIKDGGELEEALYETYLPEIGLKKENPSPSSFSIIEMQYLSSNAPSIISYTSLGTEILIICRTTSDFNRIKKSFETPVSRRLISELNRDPVN